MKKCFLLFLVTILSVSFSCKAETRSGKGEFYVSYQGLSGFDAVDDITGVEMSFDDANGLGLGFGYNFNEHVCLHTDLVFGKFDLRSLDTFDYTEETMDSYSFCWNLNVDYNVLTGPFTPYLTGGIGIMHFSSIDSDTIEDADGWDDWEDDWGDDFDRSGVYDARTSFAYNYGAGVRWDVSELVFMKAGYRAFTTKVEDTGSDVDIDGLSLTVGLKF